MTCAKVSCTVEATHATDTASVLEVTNTLQLILLVQLKNVIGCQKQKLELKFDTFWKRLTIEEEATFGKYYKLKAAINSQTVCFACYLIVAVFVTSCSVLNTVGKPVVTVALL